MLEVMLLEVSGVCELTFSSLNKTAQNVAMAGPIQSYPGGLWLNTTDLETPGLFLNVSDEAPRDVDGWKLHPAELAIPRVFPSHLFLRDDRGSEWFRLRMDEGWLGFRVWWGGSFVHTWEKVGSIHLQVMRCPN